MKAEYIQLTDYPFPDTTDIERQVLTDAIENYETLQDVSAIVKEEMFTDKDRRTLWREIITMFNNGEQVNMNSIMARCFKEFCVEITKNIKMPNTPSVMLETACLLRNVDTHRRAYQAAVSFLVATTKTQESESELYAALEEMRQDVEGEDQHSGMVPVSKVLDNIEHDFEERALSGEAVRITTGLPSMDKALYGGLEAGQLVILAARPSVGKSAVMLHMAAAAARQGKSACVFSMEMMNEDLGNRLVFSTDGVNARDFYQGRPECRDGLAAARQQLDGLPVYFNDESNSLSDVVSQITLQNKRGKCDIVFIDYLGRFQEALDNKIPLYQAIGKITGRLKSVAKRLRIPVVLLCQLNRDSAKEKNNNGNPRPPELYDLRDSGSIEQDADIVFMLESRKQESVSVEAGTISALEIPRLIVWLKKHRQGRKEFGLELRPNSTYSNFTEVGFIDE